MLWGLAALLRFLRTCVSQQCLPTSMYWGLQRWGTGGRMGLLQVAVASRWGCGLYFPDGMPHLVGCAG